MKGTGTGIRLLTTTQAGTLVGVSGRTIQNWAKGGKIPYLELPSGEFRIPLNGLLASLGGTFDLEAELNKLEAGTAEISEEQVEEALARVKGSATD